MKKASKAPWILLGGAGLSAIATLGGVAVNEVIPEPTEPEPIVIEKIVEIEVPVPIEVKEPDDDKIFVPRIKK